NHDAIDVLSELRNLDGSSVLLGQGVAESVCGLRIGAIGGIWAKSHAKSFYVTDADVAKLAAQLARSRPIDILLTHGCPVGLADLTPSGSHGGQRCFLEASKAIAPRLHLCGHLHVAQERVLKDGRKVMNVGATPDGWYVDLRFDPSRNTIEAIQERLATP